MISIPVTPEEDEIPLVVKCYNLSTLEFGQLRKCCLEHPANGMSESRYKTVEDKFRIVGSRSSMSLKTLSGCKFRR